MKPASNLTRARQDALHAAREHGPKTDAMTYAQRLEAAMHACQMTPATLARELGLSVQAISQVLKGDTRALTAENSASAARVLGVDGYWLATGDATMRPEPEEQALSLSPQETGHIVAFRLLSEDDRANFDTMVKSMARAELDRLRTMLDSPPIGPDAGPRAGHATTVDVFAERLRHYMAERRLTQAALSAKSGIAQTTISLYLRPKARGDTTTGRGGSPALANVEALAGALAVDVRELLRPVSGAECESSSPVGLPTTAGRA